MKFRSLTTAALVCAALSLSAIPASAHGEEGKEPRFEESQYRHDLMERLGKGFGKIRKISKGEAGSPADFPDIAKDMAEAASNMKAAFEKDTRNFEGHTEAKDSIWENWEDYAARLDKMNTDAQAFAAAAATGDMSKMGPAMGALGKNCKSCHDEYKLD